MFTSLGTFAVCLAALAVNAAGVVLTLLQLPGNWLIVLTTGLAAWWGWDQDPDARLLGWTTLVVVLSLALAAELAELGLGAVAAKKAGGTRRGAVYAILGGMVGAIIGSLVIPILIVGTVVGAAAGSAVGSFAGDRAAGSDVKQAARAARGAAVGRVTATVVKAAAGVVLWCAAAVGLVF